MRNVIKGAAIISMMTCGGHALAADLAPGALSPIDDQSNVLTRLYHAYADEFGKASPAADPNAPPSRRSTAQIVPQPQDSPPYPFTDWPIGGTSIIGATVPNSVDTPLQKALLPNTSAPGKALEDAHIQIYGWGDVGGNISTAKTGYNGNAPAAYDYTPNIVQLDQAVLYVERLPDTVQQDHIDWGFRVSGIYGENYRYTTALGVFSNQYVYHNHFTGYDMPMVYGEVYIPYFAEGLVIRAGRYISVPDIEAQLAPNNYTYTHSLLYSFDNYTNTGMIGTLKINKNWTAQLGVTVGTETMPWNVKQINLVNPVTGGQGYVGQRDPGTQPSLTACIQHQNDSGYDTVYLCANGINGGNWGYNNLQWFGGTYYHKFNEQWHISVESYFLYQKNVLDVSQGYGGTPFAYMVNPPLEAHCAVGQTQCTAQAYGVLAYLNYKISPLDNISLRAEFYNDVKGQRTGFATRYTEETLSLQHWLSPSIELRPEVALYQAYDAAAFDNGTKHHLAVASGDIIFHF